MIRRQKKLRSFFLKKLCALGSLVRLFFSLQKLVSTFSTLKIRKKKFGSIHGAGHDFAIATDEQSAKFDVVIDDKTPRKPSIPFLLPCSLILWGSCLLSFLGTRSFDDSMKNTLLSVFAFGLLIFLFACVHKQRRWLFLLLSFLMIGATLGVYKNISLESNAIIALNSSVTEIDAKVLEDSTTGKFGNQTILSLNSKDFRDLRVLAYLDKSTCVLVGEKLKVKGTFKSLKPESKDFNFNRSVCSILNVSKAETVSINPVLSAVVNMRRDSIRNFEEFGGQCGGLLQALVCGYKNTIEDDGTYEKFKVCGLAHTVAVSGAHLAIVISFFLLLLKKFKVSHRASSFSSVAIVLCYLLFSGIPISAVRSAIMVILCLTAGVQKRRANSLNALSLCIILFIVADASACTSVSLFLSSASTFGIIVFARLFSSWADCRNKVANGIIIQPIALTMAANLMTQPFSAAIFSQISTISVVTNIIATPLFSAACVFGLLTALISIFFPAIASFCCFGASIVAFPLYECVEILGRIPFACIPLDFDVVLSILFSALLALSLIVVWPKLSRRLACASLSVCIMLPFAFVFVSFIVPQNRIAFIDVGQGDAILIQSNGFNFLVDTGNNETKLRTGLAKLGVFSLDGVLITHHDDDHMGCLEVLRSYESIGAVYSAADAKTCACEGCDRLRSAATEATGKELCGLTVGDCVRVGNFSCKIVWPMEFSNEGGNEDSVCLKVSCNANSDSEAEFCALLTGDAEKEPLRQLLQQENLGTIDIFKIGHHGSKISVDDALLDELEPSVALISVGKGNRYGHPSSEALGLLQKHDVRVFRTDELGTIIVTPKIPTGFSVNTHG